MFFYNIFTLLKQLMRDFVFIFSSINMEKKTKINLKIVIVLIIQNIYKIQHI